MLTLAGPAEHAAEIKRSRFIARAVPLPLDPEQALARLPALLAELSEPRADHNCWAWRLGERYRSSDDGEPGGTAGRPILAAIDGQGLDHLLVVVTRYFGGIKLGAGGLVRAYGGTAAECLRRAGKLELRPRVLLHLELPFDELGTVYGLAASLGAEVVGAPGYGEGVAQLELACERERRAGLERALAERSRGRVRVVAVTPAPPLAVGAAGGGRHGS